MTNRIYITNDPRLIQDSFMVIMLAGPDVIPENAVAVYEYIDQAGPLAINGAPSFFSCKFIPRESMQAVIDETNRMSAALGMPPWFGEPQAPPAGENEAHGQ